MKKKKLKSRKRKGAKPRATAAKRVVKGRRTVRRTAKKPPVRALAVRSAQASAIIPAAPLPPKLKIGWFSFSCCEDNTVVMTEVMNDHWQEWKQLFDFRHARVLRSHNVMDEFDIAFIEGAIASEHQAATVRDIRSRSKKLVAVGACACIGLPAGQRNTFTPEQQAEIAPLVARVSALPKVQKVSDVVKVDAEIPGCPMDPNTFLAKVNALVKELRGNAL